MSRRTKIIVSVAGIFIVLLVLLGLTYAYFLTRIKGNTNDKSVDITTANLVLDYGEETSDIITKDNLMPGEVAAKKIFTVKNSGNVEISYAAILDNIVNELERNEDMVYHLECTSYLSEGFSIGNSSSPIGTVDGVCNGVDSSIFPSTEQAVMVGNSIAKDHTHYYELTLNYLESNDDQSIDMNKHIIAKVDIIDPSINNPFLENRKTLAYNILNNVLSKKNGTEFLPSPKTLPGKELNVKFKNKGVEGDSINMSIENTSYFNYNWKFGTGYEINKDNGRFDLTGVTTCKYIDSDCRNKLIGSYLSYATAWNNVTDSGGVKTTGLWQIYKVIDAPFIDETTTPINLTIVPVTSSAYEVERSLSTTQDDYGVSYYYRGNVKDNYLEFNNMCWRIVRIEGDKSIKITLAKDGLCSSIKSNDTSSALLMSSGKLKYGATTKVNKDYFNYKGYTESNGLYTVLSKWFNSKFYSSNRKKLKQEKWCLGGDTNKYDDETGNLLKDSTYEYFYYYDVGKRLYGIGTEPYATNVCPDETSFTSDYIGTLTADEVAYAGATTTGNNSLYYLQTNAIDGYWLLSYSDFNLGGDLASFVGTTGRISSSGVKYLEWYARPTIVLVPDVLFSSGDGTIDNPYKIVEK